MEPAPTTQDTSGQAPLWKRVAITTAVELELQDVIEQALLDNDDRTRVYAIRQAFIFWHNTQHKTIDQDKTSQSQNKEIISPGLLLVKKLSQQIRLRFDRKVLYATETSVVLSLLILFYDFENADTRLKLQQIWKPKIEQFMLANSFLGLGGILRNFLLQQIVRSMIRTTSGVPTTGFFNIDEASDFFVRNENLEKRKRYVQLLATYMDTTKDIAEIRDVLLEMVDERDMFIAWSAITTLKRQMLERPETTLSIVREMFEQAMRITEGLTEGNSFCLSVPARAIMFEGFSSERAIPLYIEIIERFLQKFKGKWRGTRYSRRFSYPGQLSIAEYCLANGVLLPDIDEKQLPLSEIMQRYLKNMVEEGDYEWIRDYIKLDIRQMITLGRTRLITESLAILLRTQEPDYTITQSVDSNLSQEVRDLLIDALARLRVYERESNVVDNLLEQVFTESNSYQQDGSIWEDNPYESFKREVRRRSTSENLGDLIEHSALVFWDRSVALRGSEAFWFRMRWWFGQLAESQKLEDVFVALGKLFINEIYGDAIFQDAPSPTSAHLYLSSSSSK